jgi:diguanylate cyclase (GGDEF)-like protein
MCLVEVHGENVELRIELVSPAYAIGRLADNDIVLPSPSVSRYHARLEAGATGYEVVDLESTNGTLVNEIPVQRCPLRHEDLLVVGNTAFRFLATPDLEAAVAAEVARIARTDGLTQVANRAALEEALRNNARRGLDQAVIVAEIEDFDRLEGRYKALAMDRVITLLAGQLRSRVRRSDIVARIDRRSFALLLEGADETVARRKAESLRRHVALSTFRYHEAQIPITLATGVAGVPGTLGGDAAAGLTRAALAVLRPKAIG